MNPSDQVRLHADMAGDALDGLKRLRDYRKQYVHLGIAGTHAVIGLALALDRFAAAIEKPLEENP